MSDSERWFAVLHGYNWIVETEGKPEDENFIADCGADDEAEGLAKGIVADHNGNLGIESPATTVPELVAASRRCDDEIANILQRALKRAGQGWDDLRAAHTQLKAVLAKTGKT